MNTNKFINKWYGKEIEDWGGQTSTSYKEFQKDYKSVLRDIGKDIDFNLTSFNGNHYCFSAVMQSNKTEQYYYVSVSDVRYFNNKWIDDVLYRTMENDRDWTGGNNRYSSLSQLSDCLSNLDKQMSKQLEQQNIDKSDDYEPEI